MDIDHDFMVLLAKTLGLFCFIGASILVGFYALRPSSRDRFKRAANSIIDDEDKPVNNDESAISDTENHAGATSANRDDTAGNDARAMSATSDDASRSNHGAG